MSKEMDEIKKVAPDPYKRWALEARKQYLDLRLRQDPDIRLLYIRATKRIAAKLKEVGSSRYLEQVYMTLRMEADRLRSDYSQSLESYIMKAAACGSDLSRLVTMDLFEKAGIDLDIRNLYYAVNRQAVEVCWARTTKGLRLSDRIWKQGEKYHTTVRSIIQESIALGQDVVTTARMLEKYVQNDKRTFVRDYPAITNRMGSRIPNDICYEALRLARTEMSAAFGEASLAAGRVSPSAIGTKWVLSPSHPFADICDAHAAHDEGMGRGVYSFGSFPVFPAHPNCICYTINVHADPDEFVQRLKRWTKQPGSDEELETWYQKTYKPMTGSA